MERRCIKIEIPLPDKPVQRRLTFSLKSLAILVAMTAVSLAIFNFATEFEGSRHRDGYFSYVISGATGCESGNIPRTGLTDIRSFVYSKRNQIEHWPPVIWIKRVDFDAPDLEKRIDIKCDGSSESPRFQPEFKIQPGDVVFIDAGRMKSMDEALHDVANSFGLALDTTEHDKIVRTPAE